MGLPLRDFELDYLNKQKSMWSCFVIEKVTPYIKDLLTTWNEVMKSQTVRTCEGFSLTTDHVND